MRLFNIFITITSLFLTSANALSSDRVFNVNTAVGNISVERLGTCIYTTCPAVVILSGARGFGAPAYSEIGRSLHAAGFDTFLVHVLSETDLKLIATAGSAKARIAYYAKRLPDWILAVQGVVGYLDSRPEHNGKVGLLGISLGAQIASAASSGQRKIDALVLVDGGLPNGYSQPVGSLPILHLIWGSADRVFPLSTAKNLKNRVRQLGGTVTLDVYEGEAHNFFLQSGNRNAEAAHMSAAEFLSRSLSH